MVTRKTVKRPTRTARHNKTKTPKLYKGHDESYYKNMLYQAMLGVNDLIGRATDIGFDPNLSRKKRYEKFVANDVLGIQAVDKYNKYVNILNSHFDGNYKEKYWVRYSLM